VTMPRPELLAILQSAMAEPIGLVLRTSDPTRARAALYKARAEAQDPQLACLQIRTSPFPDGNLVICKGPAPLGPRRLPVDLGDLDL
jgi:hypothetical protein